MPEDGAQNTTEDKTAAKPDISRVDQQPTFVPETEMKDMSTGKKLLDDKEFVTPGKNKEEEKEELTRTEMIKKE